MSDFIGSFTATTEDGEEIKFNNDNLLLTHGGEVECDEYGCHKTPEIWIADLSQEVGRPFEAKVTVVGGKVQKPTFYDDGNEVKVKGVKSTLKRKPDPKDDGFDD